MSRYDLTYEEHVQEEQMKTKARWGTAAKKWEVSPRLGPDCLGVVSPEGMDRINYLEKNCADLFRACAENVSKLYKIRQALTDFATPANKVLEKVREILKPEPRYFWVSVVDGHHEIHETEEKALECAPTVFLVKEEIK
jgi:hypothetical protein